MGGSRLACDTVQVFGYSAIVCCLSASLFNYTPTGYIVPMEFRVHFFPRISTFSRRTKMLLNGMLLIGNEFFKIIAPL